MWRIYGFSVSVLCWLVHYICRVNALSLAFSPCPNDTFIFDAWVNGRLQDAWPVQTVLEDIELLNRRAESVGSDLLKISFAQYPSVSSRYQILNAGAALGFGCGPILVSRVPLSDPLDSGLTVAIPGERTSANLLLSTFYPHLTERRQFLFSSIEDEVLSGRSDLGLLIHESRFTYLQKGLHKVADLGERWEAHFNQPIPLGCIVVRRDLPFEMKKMLEETLRLSVLHAFQNPQDSTGYIKQHAAELSEEVQQQHIALYVNRFSVDLGEEGRAAIRHLFRVGLEQKIVNETVEPIFLEYECT